MYARLIRARQRGCRCRLPQPPAARGFPSPRRSGTAVDADYWIGTLSSNWGRATLYLALAQYGYVPPHTTLDVDTRWKFGYDI